VSRIHKFALGLKTQKVDSGWTTVRLHSTTVKISAIKANSTNNSPIIKLIIIIIIT
jgi:hypothetical protein